MLQTFESSSLTSASLPFPTAALDNLAARVRAGGLCLLAFRTDGTLAYHDATAGAFFERFAVPLIREDSDLCERLCQVTAESPMEFKAAGGVVISASAYVERRRPLSILVLLAKSPEFSLSEDVLRVCTRLGLDAGWLESQAAGLPEYSSDSLKRQSSLLIPMLRDQLRITGMQHELNSLSEQLASTYEELNLVYKISGGMRVNRSAADFFRQACVGVLEVLNVRGMGIAINSDGETQSEPMLYGRLALPSEVMKQLAAQVLPLLHQRQNPLLVNHLARDPAFAWLAPYANHLLAVPLQRQDQILGSLFAFDKESGEFDSVDAKLVNSIANESAVYLENSRLFSDVHGLMMGLLHSLTSAVDAKDSYTCGHSERVALLSRHVARQAGLPEADIERIYMAGLLHDVGKIGVPESVLQKPGRLTAEEFDQMKKHPEIGARILADVKQLKMIIPGVLCHHERYDGNGYPAKLSGNNIPLMGRIICLADCFDAMTSSRTYRKALPLEVALTEIRRCAGTHFDPGLAEAFVSIGVEGFRELLQNHAENARKLLALQQTLRAAQQDKVMAIKWDEYAGVCVIAVRGDFVGADADQVRKSVDERLQGRTTRNFVIDFEGSRFIGSEGLEALISVRRRCEERRGEVRLAGLDDNCRKILQITRLDHRFECHPDLAAALKATE